MQNEQASDIADANSSSLAHLIGQRSVVEQVKVALDAAHEDNKKFDNALLTGPPGCGKTQTAKVIAVEMGCDFHEVLGQSVTSPADFNALLLGAKDRDVILIDECHELE
jgi:Holliday junction DNA helicase RuvB